MITPTEVRRRLKEIRACMWDDCSMDDEKAHVLEDKLHIDVLRATAAGSSDAQQLARLALNTRRVRFERWTA